MGWPGSDRVEWCRMVWSGVGWYGGGSDGVEGVEGAEGRAEGGGAEVVARVGTEVQVLKQKYIIDFKTDSDITLPVKWNVDFSFLPITYKRRHAINIQKKEE